MDNRDKDAEVRSAMRGDRGAAREPANGRLFAMLDRPEADIYPRADHPKVNIRPKRTYNR